MLDLAVSGLWLDSDLKGPDDSMITFCNIQLRCPVGFIDRGNVRCVTLISKCVIKMM